MLDTEEFSRRLHELSNERLAEKARELITQKDPTINWSKVRIVANIKAGDFRMETDDPIIEQQIRVAYEQVKVELPSDQKTDETTAI